MKSLLSPHNFLYIWFFFSIPLAWWVRLSESLLQTAAPAPTLVSLLYKQIFTPYISPEKPPRKKFGDPISLLKNHQMPLTRYRIPQDSYYCFQFWLPLRTPHASPWVKVTAIWEVLWAYTTLSHLEFLNNCSPLVWLTLIHPSQWISDVIISKKCLWPQEPGLDFTHSSALGAYPVTKIISPVVSSLESGLLKGRNNVLRLHISRPGKMSATQEAPEACVIRY